MLKKINWSIFFLSLVPLGFILKGIFPFDVTLALYILLYGHLFFRIVLSKEKMHFKLIDILFYIWSLFVLVSLFYTPENMNGLIKSAKLILLGFSLIYFVRLSISDVEKVRLFFSYLFFNSVLTGYAVVLDFLISGSTTERFLAFGEVNPIPLSLLGATTSLIAVIFLLYKEISVFKFVIAFFPGLSLIVLASSKGPVVSLIVTLLLLLPAIAKKINIKFLILVPIAVFLLSKISVIQEQFRNLLFRFSIVFQDRSTDVRLDHYTSAIDTIKEKPFSVQVSGRL